MSIFTLRIFNAWFSVDSGALRLEKRNEIPGEGCPVPAEHLWTTHFSQNADKSQAREEKEAIGFSLQAPKLFVIPFRRFDPHYSFPFVVEVVTPFKAARIPYNVIEFGPGIRRGDRKQGFIEVGLAGESDSFVDLRYGFAGESEHKES